MVTMRSSPGMADDKTLSSVVLPEPVPPETRMLQRAITERRRKRAMRSSSEPSLIMSSTPSRLVGNLRMVTQGPRSATGGMTALTREPSGRRASTIGVDSSMRRPSGVTMRSMARRRASSVEKLAPESVSLPFCST